MSLSVVGAVAAVGVAVGVEEMRAGSTRLLPCRVLPNRIVPFLAARSSECPLRAYDRVLAIRNHHRLVFLRDAAQLRALVPREALSVGLLIRRRSQEAIVDVPVQRPARGHTAGRVATGILVAATLLGTGLLILWNAETGAGVALLLFYGCVSILLMVTLAREESRLLAPAGTVSLGLIAPGLTHLALSFPKERGVLRAAPGILIVPYGAAAALIAVSLGSFERTPGVWAMADRLMISLATIAVMFVLVGCVSALRQAASEVERARARICLCGMLAVVALPSGLNAFYGGAPPGGSATLIGLGAALFPLPIAYAISRYQLFDVALDVQRAMAHLVVPTVTAMFLTVGAMALDHFGVVHLPCDEPAAVYAVLFGVLLICELLRIPLWHAADSWASRHLDSLRRVRDAHAAAIAELGTSLDYGRTLGRTIEIALRCRRILVYVGTRGDWRLVHGKGANGEKPLPARVVEDRVFRCDQLVHLAREEMPEFGMLRAKGFEVVAPVRTGQGLFGAVLIGPSDSGQPYTSLHLDLVRAVCVSTAISLHNANLVQDLAGAERFAAAGRLAAELAHEFGKPLGLLERYAMRLPAHLPEPERAERDAKRIFELSRELRRLARKVLESGRNSSWNGKEMRADELVERAIRAASHESHEPRVVVRLEPGLPAIPRAGDRLVRALANLIDNAVLAGRPDQTVEITARTAGHSLRIEIADQGRGMEPEVAARAFEPFFTTRSGGGGSGLGLSFAREAVEELGGRIEIQTEFGKGTRLMIDVPMIGTKGSASEGTT